MILDPNLNGNERETKMEQIVDDALKAVNDDDIKVFAQHIRFIVDQEVASKVYTFIMIKFIEEIGLVTVSGISSTMATVQMQSAHDKQLVQYAVRFAKQTGDGDGDNEKADWTQVELDTNADEYELNELEMSEVSDSRTLPDARHFALEQALCEALL